MESGIKERACYKAAVVGLGQIGLIYDCDPKRVKPSSHSMAYDLNSRMELAACIDPRESQYEMLRSLIPNAPYFSSLKSLYDLPIDVISVCTPPLGRLMLIKELIDNTGAKAIFCEKPLAMNANEAEQWIELFKSCRNVLFIPNLSRRWSSGFQRISSYIQDEVFGKLINIHVRYTRGIYNTGAHLFDLLHWFAGEMEEVYAYRHVVTSSDKAGEPTFSFLFRTKSQVEGHAEGLPDDNYLLFELDFYFERGKIEVRESGNRIQYFETGPHPLFSGFQYLHFKDSDENQLFESHLANAVEHIARVLDGVEKQPCCGLQDGLYPVIVAEALLRSADSNSWEKVGVL